MTLVGAGSGETASARWRRLVEARLEEMEELRPGGSATDSRFWDRRRAKRYHDRLPTERAAGDPFLRRVRRATRRSDTVIDVGAGTGRFALNLAPRAALVLAVDPSPEMLAVLRREARRLGVGNVQTVQGRWQDVDVAPGDIAFSSYVLPLLPDAPAFLTKLDGAARRQAFLYLGAFSMDAAADALWRHFHGIPRRPGPTYLDAIAVLQELGIDPDVEVVELPNRTRFTTVAEAAKEYQDFLQLPPGRATTKELERLLPMWLARRHGAFAPPLRYVPAAIVSWNVKSKLPGRA